MALDQEQDHPIIVKRKRGRKNKKHSGAWKIAYADFVTAMMAFFLLMWIMGTTSKTEQEYISDFFKNPPSFISNKSGANPNPIDFQGSAKSRIASRPNKLTNNAMTEQESLKRKHMLDYAKKVLEEEEMRSINRLKNKVEETIKSSPVLSQFKEQLLIEVTKDGLLIQVIDKENRPMFETGQNKMLPYTVNILSNLSGLMNEVPNKIRITGHTDSDPFNGANEKYGNWDLSSNRAVESMHVMVNAKLNPDRIDRISGVSDTQPLITENPFAPQNRRISILVLKKNVD